MTIHDIDIRPGDKIIVDAPARHLGDDRPVTGVVTVLGVYPNHLCGPCLYFCDDIGRGCIQVSRRDVVGAVINAHPAQSAKA